MTEFGNAARIGLVGTVLLLLAAVELQAQNAADVVNVLDDDLTTYGNPLLLRATATCRRSGGS